MPRLQTVTCAVMTWPGSRKSVSGSDCDRIALSTETETSSRLTVGFDWLRARDCPIGEVNVGGGIGDAQLRDVATSAVVQNLFLSQVAVTEKGLAHRAPRVIHRLSLAAVRARSRAYDLTLAAD